MYWPYNVNIDFFSEMKCSTLCHSISRENVIIGKIIHLKTVLLFTTNKGFVI